MIIMHRQLPNNYKYIQDGIKPIQDGYSIYLESRDGVKDGYTSYDNGKWHHGLDNT